MQRSVGLAQLIAGSEASKEEGKTTFMPLDAEEVILIEDHRKKKKFEQYKKDNPLGQEYIDWVMDSLQQLSDSDLDVTVVVI